MNSHRRSKTKHADRPLLIGITGSIASGKTTVANWFRSKGEQVISTDRIGHRILDLPEIKQRLENKFGKSIFVDNQIDRKKLSKKVFNDNKALNFLNDLLHPIIRNKTQHLIDASQSEVLFIEIPLLFENDLQDAFDAVINVETTKQQQFFRLKQNRDMNEKEIKDRLSAQFSAEKKKQLADLNIKNEGTKKELFNFLEELYPEIKKIKKRDVKKLSGKINSV